MGERTRLTVWGGQPGSPPIPWTCSFHCRWAEPCWGAEAPLRTQADESGLTSSCRAPARYSDPTGVSIAALAAGGTGATGRLVKLTGCRCWGALGPAVLHLHREHSARAGRRGLQRSGPCGKPHTQPSGARMLVPTVASPLRQSRLSHQQMDQLLLPVPHQPSTSPLPPGASRGFHRFPQKEPSQHSPGSPKSGSSPQGSTPVSTQFFLLRSH